MDLKPHDGKFWDLTDLAPPLPLSPDDWQNAATAAAGFLVLESARQYGLVKGGPLINVDRADAVLRAAAFVGIGPEENAAELIALQWNEYQKRRGADRPAMKRIPKARRGRRPGQTERAPD